MLGEVRGRRGGGRLGIALFVAVLVAGVAIAASGPSGAITVSSDPAGATVKVDNVVRGVTPLELRDLTPGSHRIAVAKAGYLENMRVVQVTSGASLNVDVRLTSTSLPAQETTTAVQPKSGGSKLKWILPIAGGGGAAAAFLLLRSSNSPPTVSGVTASPSTGLQGATSIAFSASGSDPNGDALTYSWVFGDGGTGSGQSPTHVYNASGSYTATVTVSDGKANATGNANVTIGSLSGNWHGDLGFGYTPSCGNWLTWNLTQSGSSITGSHYDTTNGNRGITGSVSSPMNFSITLSSGVVYSGTVNSGFNQMTGTATGYYGGLANFVICK